MDNGEDSLGVVLICQRGEQVRGQGDAAEAATGLLVHQLAGEFAGQQIRGVEQGFDLPAGLHGLADVMDALHEKQAGFLASFLLAQSAHLFDERVAAAGDEFGHGLILPDFVI